MDSTDVRIFCEMAFRDLGYDRFTERRPSAAEMGKKLSLDEKTVRTRIARMEESGFIKYYQATPSLALFGMRTVSLYRLETLNLATKYAIINSLHQVPRLVEASDYLGPFITANIAGATGEEAKSVADKLASHYELGTTLLGERALTEPSVRLDRLDWQIMEELRYDARSGDKDLSKALSVTERMIGYRMTKLLGTGAVHLRAVIDPRKQAGLVFYELELLLDVPRESAISKWLRERHGDKLWNLTIAKPGVVLASLFSFTLAEPEESVIEALKQEGVRRCFLFILKEVLEPARSNWIDSLIQLRIVSQGDETKPARKDKAPEPNSFHKTRRPRLL